MPLIRGGLSGTAFSVDDFVVFDFRRDCALAKFPQCMLAILMNFFAKGVVAIHVMVLFVLPTLAAILAAALRRACYDCDASCHDDARACEDRRQRLVA